MSNTVNSGEIRRLQRALEESEGRRQALLDSALDCVICTDGEARITDFNAASERTFRVARSAVLGKDLAETILPTRLWSSQRKELFLPAAGGVSAVGRRVETSGLRSDGTEFPAEITVTSIELKGHPAFIIYVRDISARKRAEQAVVWLAAIVESSQDAIIGKDLEGRITSWNKAAERMYGYSAAEAIGKSVSMLIPPERLHEFAAIGHQLRAGRHVHNFETVRRAKNGARLDVSLSVSPVFDSDVNIIGGSAIARDITEQKHVAAALRKANDTSIYASPIPIIGGDSAGLVTLWNPAAEQVFGWKENEVLGKPNPIIPQSAMLETQRLRHRLLSGETITNMEVHRVKRDGTPIIVSLSATPLWDANHTVRGIIGFLVDITDRKAAEETLRVAEEKYRSIFENSVEGIYQTTRDGQYISANPALARMLGFDSPEELIAARLDIRNQEYVEPSLRDRFINLLEQHGAVREFEYQAYRKDRRIIWVSENAQAVRDASGRVLYLQGTVQDVTQARELEQVVRQMQRIEAIGHLAGGVAHDFNNILMAISSYAELLSRKLPLGDANLRYVREIERAMSRGASLTQSLLAFSRKQVLAPVIVDMNILLAQQADMLRRLIGENIELRFLPADGLGKVKADPVQFEQVVMNLVINARDAMPAGGAITLRTENVSDSDGWESTAEGNAPFVMLSVSDNGTGMDAETKSHIFEPFFTTKEQGKGTGLGLATVFGIVKQSAGYISVDSEPGKGTTFRIYLPRIEGAVSDEGQILGTSFDGDETILLVEDEEAVRMPTTEYLTQHGYKVLPAGRGTEALEIAEEYQQPIHLVLTDLIMPQMSGKELSEKIVQVHPEARIVFMSGYSRDLLSRQQTLGAQFSLLQKPFRLAELGRFIRRALNRGQAAGAGNG